MVEEVHVCVRSAISGAKCNHCVPRTTLGGVRVLDSYLSVWQPAIAGFHFRRHELKLEQILLLQLRPTSYNLVVEVE